jgi:hypothetical protein
MASSYEGDFAAGEHDAYLYQESDSQPPSPNGYSAAGILAAMSDSRPHTSHAEHVNDMDQDEWEDTDTGGISLADEEEDVDATTTMPTLTEHPSFFDATHTLHDTPSVYSHQSSPAAAAAALEVLTMDAHPSAPVSHPPPPALMSYPPAPYNLPHFGMPYAFVTVPPTSALSHLPDFQLSAYEEHLSIHDNGAFMDIASYYHYFAARQKMVTKPLEFETPPEVIRREDLNGDKCDFQGIDWSERGGRDNLRQKRDMHEAARLSSRGSRGMAKHWVIDASRYKIVPSPTPGRNLVKYRYRNKAVYEEKADFIMKRHPLNDESFFSFRRMDTRHRAYYPHFQLRNVMAATSRNDIYYATKSGVQRTNASGATLEPVVDLRKRTVNGNECQITTLAASNNVLVAGGFEGDYYIANLAPTDDDSFTTGMIRDWSPDTKSYITNHVHLFNSRSSYSPQAVLCSNDAGLRVLDCATDTFRSSFAYPSAVNCSDTSPDGRMRVVVGDFEETLITNAETGEPFETLKAHRDDAFACAWADDGIHVASAAQDSTIAVWDARNWSEPIAMINSEYSVPRALRFSPVGSGPRVLIAAEADDYINVINAQTFKSKQLFDFFGPTAGISMTPDGQSLFVANAERRFGGIIELERSGWGEAAEPRGRHDVRTHDDWTDWDVNDGFDHDRRVPCGFGQRDRRGLDLGELVI